MEELIKDYLQSLVDNGTITTISHIRDVLEIKYYRHKCKVRCSATLESGIETEVDRTVKTWDLIAYLHGR